MKKSILIIVSALTIGACGYNSDKSTILDEANGFYANSEPVNNGAAPPPPSSEMDITSSISVESNQGTISSFSDVSNKKNSAQGNSVGGQTKTPSKIRKNAYLNITVDDYKKARSAVEKIIKSANAYIASENEQNNTYSLSNNMIIRVINKDFDGMVNSVSGVASHVNSKNITVDDVTAQFVDIETRLKSKKEIEKRYLDILNRASKVSDILEVEQNLGVIREEIEAQEGQLKLLADQVDYSTINLTFTQNFEYTPVDRPGFFGRTGNAFEKGWDGFLGFVVDIISVWPLWLMLAAIAYFLTKFLRKKFKTQK